MKFAEIDTRTGAQTLRDATGDELAELDARAIARAEKDAKKAKAADVLQGLADAAKCTVPELREVLGL